MKKNMITTILIIIAIVLCIVTITNDIMISKTKSKIISLDKVSELNDYKVVVLGAAVYGDRLSYMLKDRLDMAVSIYNKNSNNIVISGDNENDTYNEIEPMRKYLIQNGIKEENIIEDKYGLSTYDSIYRMKEVYGYDKIIIITQEYHLYRSLYIADELGIEVYGYKATDIEYKGQGYRQIREILARTKDYFKVLFKGKSKYLDK